MIDFLTKEGSAAVEIYARLRNVYGDTVIDISNVRRWMRRFQDGETKMIDKARSGRPSIAINPEKQELVEHLIRGNRHITIAEMADELQVSYGSVQKDNSWNGAVQWNVLLDHKNSRPGVRAKVLASLLG